MALHRIVYVLGISTAIAGVFATHAIGAADDNPSPNGTWKWSWTAQNGQVMESTLKLDQQGDKLTGTVRGRDGKDVPIQEATIKDGEIAFKVPRERDGQKFVTRYQGKLGNDAIKGTVEVELGGETRKFDWEAKRVKE